MRQASAILEFDPEPAADRPRVVVFERADPIPAERLREITETLLECTERVFPGHEVTVRVGPDTGWDSYECHLIAITVDVGTEFDVEQFVRDEQWVFGSAIDTLTTEEFQAITILFDPACFHSR